MIPLTVRRQAERRLLEAKIAAHPSPARFRTYQFNVLLADPPKARELKAAGFGASWTGDCYLVLPVGDAVAPASETETITVQDWSGVTQSYTLTAVTPLLGLGCFRCGLRPRKVGAAARGAQPGA